MLFDSIVTTTVRRKLLQQAFPDPLQAAAHRTLKVEL